MKNLCKILAICAGIGAAVGAIFCFREEIADFMKKIINKIDAMRCDRYHDCCFDDGYDDFSDFDDVSVPEEQ